MSFKPQTKYLANIAVCSSHPEFQVPLISTYKFKGAEFWCPFCGQCYGLFGNYLELKVTETLKNRLKKYKAHSTSYLESDNGTYEYNKKL